MQIRFFADNGNADNTDDNTQGHLSAILGELRRLTSRYGVDAVQLAAQAAAFAFDATSPPKNSAALHSLFGAPTFTSCTPSSGTHSTGTAVTIAGTNFAPGTAVTIGGEAATSFVRVSATSLTCHTPSDLVAGSDDIVITTPSGLAVTAAGAWTST